MKKVLIVYCNTKVIPKMLGEVICKFNFIANNSHSWLVKDKGEFCTIEVNSKSNCVAVIYSIGNSVVGVEVDDDCASKVIEPLIETYGFEKVKWLSTK